MSVEKGQGDTVRNTLSFEQKLRLLRRLDDLRDFLVRERLTTAGVADFMAGELDFPVSAGNVQPLLASLGVKLNPRRERKAKPEAAPVSDGALAAIETRVAALTQQVADMHAVIVLQASALRRLQNELGVADGPQLAVLPNGFRG